MVAMVTGDMAGVVVVVVVHTEHTIIPITMVDAIMETEV